MHNWGELLQLALKTAFLISWLCLVSTGPSQHTKLLDLRETIMVHVQLSALTLLPLLVLLIKNEGKMRKKQQQTGGEEVLLRWLSSSLLGFYGTPFSNPGMMLRTSALGTWCEAAVSREAFLPWRDGLAKGQDCPCCCTDPSRTGTEYKVSGLSGKNTSPVIWGATPPVSICSLSNRASTQAWKCTAGSREKAVTLLPEFCAHHQTGNSIHYYKTHMLIQSLLQ